MSGRHHRIRLDIALLGAALATTVLLAASCSPAKPSAPPQGAGSKAESAQTEPRRLEPAEVTEYRGERLDPSSTFRENSIKGPQAVDPATYWLEVKGAVARPAAYTYDEIVERASFEKVVRISCVEGWSANILWRGIRIADLIGEADPSSGAVAAIFHCADGYTTSLPLAYLDERDILLAYRMNGIVLPAERGFPFQVVAEDKWGYKWAKWVTDIEVTTDADYLGYWEQRGYDNDADLAPKP